LQFLFSGAIDASVDVLIWANYTVVHVIRRFIQQNGLGFAIGICDGAEFRLPEHNLLSSNANHPTASMMDSLGFS